MEKKIAEQLNHTVEKLGVMPTNSANLEFHFYSVCLQVTNKSLNYPVPTFRVLSINKSKAEERYNYQQLCKVFSKDTVRVLKKNDCYLLNNDDDVNDNVDEKQKLKEEYVKYEYDKQADFNKRRFEKVKTDFEANQQQQFQESMWVQKMSELRKVDPEFKPEMGKCIDSEYLTAQKYRNNLTKHTHEEIVKLVCEGKKEQVDKLEDDKEPIYNRPTPFVYYNEPLMKEMYDKYMYDLQQSQQRHEDEVMENLSDEEMEKKVENDNILSEPFVLQGSKLKNPGVKFVTISYIIDNSKDKLQILFWVHAHFKDCSIDEQAFTANVISKYSYPLSLHNVKMGHWVSPCHNEWFIGSDKVEQVSYDNQKFSDMKQKRTKTKKDQQTQVQRIQEYRKKNQSKDYVAKIKEEFKFKTDYDAEIFITASYNHELEIQKLINDYSQSDNFVSKCYEFIEKEKQQLEPTFIKHWAMDRLYLTAEDYDHYLKYTNEDEKQNLISHLENDSLFERMKWYIEQNKQDQTNDDQSNDKDKF